MHCCFLPQRPRRLILCALLGLALGTPAFAADVTLSGTVTDVTTGLPIQGVSVGGSRVAVLGSGQPDDPILVELTVSTNASGYYVFVPDTVPDLDRVLVFTRSAQHLNKLYDGVIYDGRKPTFADIAEPGIVEVDVTSSAANIDFAIDSYSGMNTHMVPMNDGTLLATDVCLPGGDGPWPVVLYRTPYGRTSDSVDGWLGWNANGYAVVTQDMRGCGDSKGVFRLFFDDGWGGNRDGNKTVLWVLAQPWCDGDIGTIGSSARGISQNFLMSGIPPGLRCQHIGAAASNLYTQAIFQGGAYRHSLAETWTAPQGPEAVQYLHETIFAHPHYDDDYWPSLNPELRYPLVTWPTVNRGGWYDIFLRGTINNFLLLQHNGQPGSDGNHKLILDAYGHGKHGEFQFPPGCKNAPAAYAGSRAWLDYWVKGIDTGVMDEPPVCYYVLGDVNSPSGPGNEWRFADDWPIPATDVAFYLHEGGLLDTVPPAPT